MHGRTRLRSLLLTATVAALTATALAGAASASARSAPPGPNGPLDHFLCYRATSPTSTVVPGFKPPAAVRLQNQFNPNGFTAQIRAFTTHCNPVQKTLPTGEVFKVENPAWHLGCWSIAPSTDAKLFRVKVTNQFGTGELNTKRPTQLCLPSLKSEKAPPTFIRPGPNEVRPDNFTCYPVTYLRGGATFTPPAAVRLRDQFTPAGANYTAKIGLPKSLCLPTATTVANKPPTKINDPREHLLCFSITGRNPATLPRTVYDRNVFGVGAVRVVADGQTLCLPSFKTIIG